MKRLSFLFFFLIFVYGNLYAIELKRKHTIFFDKHSAPSDVVFNNDGTFLVYESYSGSILKYKDNKLIGKNAKSEFKNGTCFVSSGNVYFFCSNATNSILILDKNFTVIKKLLYNTMEKRFDPTDVLAIGDDVYVVDNDNHKIHKFSIKTGKVIASIGGYGQDKLMFWYPYTIAYDPKSKGILVLEVLNTRIQKITTGLKFYEFLGGWGIKGGQFFRPTGMAVTKKGNILVGDGYNGKIQILNSDGDFLFSNKKDYGSVVRIRVSNNMVGIIDGWNKMVYIEEIWGEP